ncbi:MAG TPA: tetratricopeptide repeat protein, partial [Anaeromyxobacteraceae bacterium]
EGLGEGVRATPTATQGQGAAAAPVPPPPPSPASLRKSQQGEDLVRAGDWRGALFAFQEAVNLSPRSAAPRLRLGDAYEKLGYHDEAAKQFDLAAALEPPGVEAQRRAERARAAREGRAPPPEPAAAQPRPPGPPDTPAAGAYEQGVSFVSRGQYAEALAALDEAIRRDPRLPVAYTARGAALFGLGRYVEAAGDYRTALALDPAQATPLFGLGECYRLLQQPAAAVEHYGRYVQSVAPDAREDLRGEARARIGELGGR